MPRSLRLGLLHKTLLLCLPLLPLCVAHASNSHDWDFEETRTDSRDFVSGGMLHVHLTVGELHIKRGDSNKIQLRYTIKSRNAELVT